MLILPAIDILGGTCVRLTRGDYTTSEKVAEDPVQTARDFEIEGAEWLHMVDLDGAKAGEPKNLETVARVITATNLNVELGGGIRNMDAIRAAFELGVSRVILGSAALLNPELVREAVALYGEKIAVGIDAMDGRVRTGGWFEDSNVYFTELAQAMDITGVRTLIYTDISRDGTLAGPNAEQLAELSGAVSADIIASGGVRDIDDVRELRELGLYGVILGKALYRGTIDLAEAIEAAEQRE
ncbi:MAG: 1-(5-phosphoribosyl)-5-[(5-phosphoribosylamino)methylideneamino]imidazole-4-carboxamide isomerase [Clostridiales Family XIII bacterium]|jgi:phosphoribosylformimino-5-aminoimidazole carboxamide ribotide isomerase|nr:1-(5-phosphoribosyl)-5-[(5-phosphoribosylamino)methylideneamino]imidazole-4-carboxamide isomerase [Clostridiales Family XIII bacterium]